MSDRFSDDGLRNPAGLRPVRDPADELRLRGFRVGQWQVEPRLNQLRAGDVERRVDPRVTDMLVHLAVRSGDVVTRDELMAAVWGRTFVSENTLSQTVSRLRKALDDDWQAPRFVETIAKSGYRLIAPVEMETITGPEPATPQEPVTAPAPPPVTGGSVALRLGFATVALVVAIGGWFWFGRMPSDVPPVPPPVAIPEITLPGRQIDPVLSPDGTRIAFAWQGPDRESLEIYVKQVGAETLLRLSEGPGDALRIAWTADGLHLAFLQAEGDSCGVFRVAALGGPTERIGDCRGGLRDVDWSPDGTTLVFSGADARDTPRNLFTLDVSTGSITALIPAPEAGRGDTSPAYSPDGKWVAFVRMPLSARHEVWVAAADGSNPRPLTADRWGQIRGLDWSADGRSIVFSSNRNGRFALWSVPPSGGEPIRLPIQDEWVTDPSIASTGRVIYKNYADVTDIWQVDLDPHTGTVVPETLPAKIVASTRSELYPALAPDGAAIAFTSNRTGHFEVWSADRDGTNLMRHTDFRGPRPGAPRWSPDGRHIVFDADAEGQSDVWFVARESRQPRRLTDDPSEDRNPVFARDGSSIYFASNREDGWQIWALPSTGGAPTRVTTDGGFLAQEGALGEYLYWIRIDEPGIWRRPLEGGETTHVLTEPAFDDWGSWQVTRGGIWYIHHNPTTILLHRFDSGETLEVHKTAKQVPYLARSLSVAEDESLLLFGMIDNSDDEIMRVDLVSGRRTR